MMSRKIVQLGYGKMGKTVLNDLLKTAQFDELVVADASPNFISEIAAIEDQRVKPVNLDVDDQSALVSLIKGADVVVELLPVRYTMQVAQAAVEAGTHMVSSVFIIDWSTIYHMQIQLAISSPGQSWTPSAPTVSPGGLLRTGRFRKSRPMACLFTATITFWP
jgi:pyrroline-5-carboxylate reductase